MQLRFLAVLLMVFWMSGCASSVYFHDQPRSLISPADSTGNTVEIFLDREGQLYPEGPEFAPDQLMPSGSLRYMARQRGDLCGDPAEHSDGPTSPELSLLCESAQDTTAWQARQTDMWRSRVSAVVDRLPTEGRGDLVILIHGFNVQSANGSYEDVKSLAREESASGCDTVFVEVHWNGYSGFLSWDDAQYSGPLAGFALREFFYHLNRAIPASNRDMPRIAVLTHSSGAYVAASTFGNPYHLLEGLHDPARRQVQNMDSGGDLGPSLYQQFYENRATMGGPHGVPELPGLRVAMFAPATSDWALNADPRCHMQDQPCDTPHGLLIEGARVVVAFKAGDYALRKMIWPFDLSRFYGSSGLGINRRQACRVANQVTGEAGENETRVDVIAYPFEGYTGLRVPDFLAHNWNSYLVHPSGQYMLSFAVAPEISGLAPTLECS